MKMLLLEDEYMLLSSIKSFLLQKNHSVDAFESGKEALDAFLSGTTKYDMFLLDINTPEMSGLELLKRIREKEPDAPVIMITANIDIGSIDKAYGFGCSEYLKKPFNLRELELRIQRLTPAKTKQNLIQITENYSFETETDNLLYKGEAVKLTKRQTALIRLLIKNNGRVLDYEKIKSFVWADEYVEDSTVRSLVNRLRSSVKEEFIENYRGIGYKMNITGR
ncbi:MAG: response regulator transcription factor [Campylobacterales bacterium]